MYSTEHWPTAEITGLDPETVNEWRAIAEVFQYSGATATFKIEAAATKGTKTTIPLTVENHLTDAIRIGVYDSNSDETADKCVGVITTTSAPFQHIAVKGTVVSAGGLEEVGYFLNNAQTPSWGANLIYVRADVLVAGDHLLDKADVFLSGEGADPPGAGIPLDLATDYWINFFGSTVDHTTAGGGSADDFVYDETSNPNGVEFQIPKVVNNNIVYSQGESFANQLKITFGGDVEGDDGKFQSDASGWGFVWIEADVAPAGEPGLNKVFMC